MASRTDRLEARLEPGQRERIRAAADALHTSLSAFVVSAAVEKAESVLLADLETLVPGDYFESLLDSLDDRSPIAELERAAQRTRDDRRFTRR